MAKKKSTSKQEEDALKDFIKKSGITLSEARMMLEEARRSAESRAMADVEEYNKGGMSTKKSRGASDYRKGGMVLSSVDNRKNK